MADADYPRINVGLATDPPTSTVKADIGQEYCDLTDIFGWLLQLVLAALAFTCLIVKRYFEPRFDRRAWRIWFYDTSKQGLGALVTHMSNIFISNSFKDPCSRYVVNFLLDSSIGLILIYFGIRVTKYISAVKKWEAIEFGEYGLPPSSRNWLIQCILYIFLMLVVKIIIILLVQIPFWSEVTVNILSLFPNKDVRSAVVVLIIPLIVNVIIFWVTDNFLMHRSGSIETHKDYRMKVKIGGSDSDVFMYESQYSGVYRDEEMLDDSPHHHGSPGIL